MKELTLNKSQKMYAEKIIKREHTVISEDVTKLVTDIFGYNGDKKEWAFYNLDENIQYELADGQEWDMPEDEEKNQRITDLELALAVILGGGL